MKIDVIPALQDNYMYLLTDPKTNQAAIVDPVEPEKVLAAVNNRKVDLTTVITTHHHWDHAGGNDKLVGMVSKKLKVYGGDERIGSLTEKLSGGEEFNIGSLVIKSLATPCHTSGHICYFVSDPNSQESAVVFTGDTLFVGGCGRFFEGTPAQMYNALCNILGKLPSSTRVYCGHEYSASNLIFAIHVEPDNVDIQKKLEWVKKQRANRLVTVPSTIAEELSYNPFMRVNTNNVRKHTGKKSGIEAMGYLREEKNNFKAKA
ncbi:uncharacterized protein TRIADDRAFT_20939 [Trichoplax adhaerens]|uniref:hydroxyacylglutathione hydrolase n=1 Tax=Trichoplax adhaerens TaxID=10228 RepID=B3RPZ7_TRIAD|nr:hypothetical protein TRIADDRAFT_20939 [Trichoplax adhaerens]EDV28270.1 hypothetical protein TRIADDRAFT_20939 [Trichoplax adhaerens]|eukprot:XP_002110104.1 hypothetical protein TRIADDRAFT_20939 [Trichoplax adhaerens]